MSRSRKAPVIGDKKDKRSKRAANKRVRKWIKGLDAGFKGYSVLKKIYDPYEIQDYQIDAFNDDTHKEKFSRK